MNRLSRESHQTDLYKSAGPMQCPSFINNVKFFVCEASLAYNYVLCIRGLGLIQWSLSTKDALWVHTVEPLYKGQVVSGASL